MTPKFLWRIHGERWEKAMEKIADNPIVKSIKNAHKAYLRKRNRKLGNIVKVDKKIL